MISEEEGKKQGKNRFYSSFHRLEIYLQIDFDLMYDHILV